MSHTTLHQCIIYYLSRNKNGGRVINWIVERIIHSYNSCNGGVNVCVRLYFLPCKFVVLHLVSHPPVINSIYLCAWKKLRDVKLEPLFPYWIKYKMKQLLLYPTRVCVCLYLVFSGMMYIILTVNFFLGMSA